MGTLLRRALQLLMAPRPRGRALNGFLESLLQKFEDCRPGLADDVARSSGGAAEPYFLDLYDRERTRLEQAIRLQEAYLSDEDVAQFQREVDDLVRRVVVPAYVRHATRFTLRERNDFYHTPEHAHWIERLGWCVAGMLVGAFVVWAPFIPLTAKEWVLPFALGGLFYPNLRSVFAFRRYERELNRLVDHADREIERIDVAYLTRRRHDVALPETSSGSAGSAVRVEEPRPESGSGTASQPTREGTR